MTSGNPWGLQLGDLEGLSNVESVDSESADELLKDAFETGVVSGTGDSRERDAPKEVCTGEIHEDDVPGE